MREGGVLKLSHLYMFFRQRTKGTFAAPLVGEMYGIKQMFQWISIQHPAYYQTAENCFSKFSNFSVTGDQTTQKRHFVGFWAKFSKSGPAHIRMGRTSTDRPPINIEETRVKKLIAHVSAIYLLPVFEKSVYPPPKWPILCRVGR